MTAPCPHCGAGWLPTAAGECGSCGQLPTRGRGWRSWAGPAAAIAILVLATIIAVVANRDSGLTNSRPCDKFAAASFGDQEAFARKQLTAFREHDGGRAPTANLVEQFAVAIRGACPSTIGKPLGQLTAELYVVGRDEFGR